MNKNEKSEKKVQLDRGLSVDLLRNTPGSFSALIQNCSFYGGIRRFVDIVIAAGGNEFEGIPVQKFNGFSLGFEFFYTKIRRNIYHQVTASYDCFILSMYSTQKGTSNDESQNRKSNADNRRQRSQCYCECLKVWHGKTTHTDAGQ